MEVVCRAQAESPQNVTELKTSLLMREMAIRKASASASSGEPIGSMAALPCNNTHPLFAFCSSEVRNVYFTQNSQKQLLERKKNKRCRVLVSTENACATTRPSSALTLSMAAASTLNHPPEISVPHVVATGATTVALKYSLLVKLLARGSLSRA